MYIDPHIHMISRTTDDYEAMAAAGIVAVIEPSFWLGQPRTSVGTFKDYFSSLIGWERFRAAQFGIQHYCTMGLNAREANNEALAEQVMEILPLFVGKQYVVGIGEIGYDEQTEAEDKYYRLQLQMAKKNNAIVQVHTPHRDKKNGTHKSMKVALEHGLDPKMVIIDHNNEETVKEVLDHGFWAAFTIYPYTKMGNERMVEIIKQYGTRKIIINSAADWGISDPLAVPKTATLMQQRGFDINEINTVCYANALAAFGQTGRMQASDWLQKNKTELGEKYQNNTILRGGQLPEHIHKKSNIIR